MARLVDGEWGKGPQHIDGRGTARSVVHASSCWPGDVPKNVSDTDDLEETGWARAAVYRGGGPTASFLVVCAFGEVRCHRQQREVLVSCGMY